MDEEPKKLTLGDILPKPTLDDVIERPECECEQCRAEMKQAEEEIDQHLDRLQEYIGRGLVEIERRAVLDIVGENSTKDENGTLCCIFPLFRRGRSIIRNTKRPHLAFLSTSAIM